MSNVFEVILKSSLNFKIQKITLVFYRLQVCKVNSGYRLNFIALLRRKSSSEVVSEQKQMYLGKANWS